MNCRNRVDCEAMCGSECCMPMKCFTAKRVTPFSFISLRCIMCMNVMFDKDHFFYVLSDISHVYYRVMAYFIYTNTIWG